jgi:hypothetical protein
MRTSKSTYLKDMQDIEHSSWSLLRFQVYWCSIFVQKSRHLLISTYFPPHHLLHPWQPNTLVPFLAHNSHVSSVVAIGGPKQSSHTQKLPAALLCCRQNHLTTTESKHYINMDLDKYETCHIGFIFGKRF